MQNRTNRITVRLTDDELARMKFKMDEAGISCMSSYMRKMLLDGYCVKVDTSDFKEVCRLVRICSNNLNQYAKKANGLGVVNQADINDLKTKFADLNENTKELKNIFASLRNI